MPAERVYAFVRAALATFGRHGGEPAAYSSSSRSRVKFEWVEAALEAQAHVAADAAAEATEATAAAERQQAEQQQLEQGGGDIAARVRQTFAAWFR